MNRSTGILLGIAGFFAGLAIGLIFKGDSGDFGSHNGNTVNRYYGQKPDPLPEEEEAL